MPINERLVRARGVRYATASRFAAPEPYKWDGVIDAGERGPACPQPPSALAALVGSSVDGLTFDEHCQVLSVTAPADASGLPVMVWFHGGAYVTGSGESTKYDAGLLASEGVVVVSVSYRLGVFGYLQDNLGLLDQLTALRWVRDNIAAFGGDPANVTAFGQSAGADSVYALMLTDTENLFHRAILQSAPLGTRSPERAEMTAALRASISVDTTTSADDVLVAQIAAVAEMGPRFAPSGGMPFAPVLDEIDLAAAASRVELLVGHTADDGSPYVPTREHWEAVTELIFALPARELAQDWTAAGGQAATYNFRWAPADAPMGSCHCMELPFLFDPDGWIGAGMLAGQEPDAELAKTIRSTWAGFARNGMDALPSRSLEFGG
ncbi:carboxylesterase family protein [Lentzea sp. BCCO 10_0061]|uniref:Carboxylesterase family protein n=1 Tax=Lentzea sokolovensis TaxID=3095429 RepID=A0ABU4V438_9PSEU|nr:carboxylesterase family protein [Lentzea sp. BCCO 10_0061]MDX8145999.1 carboxylesterase family protein [Lentzea sp. BCCO 10_0061]